MNRKEFMEYFRSDKYSEELSPDDKAEVFLSSLQGGTDITVELLNNLFAEYDSEGFLLGRVGEQIVIDKPDWALLRMQKQDLLKAMGAQEGLAGLLEYIDHIQDQAVLQGFTEQQVFGFKTEEEDV